MQQFDNFVKQAMLQGVSLKSALMECTALYRNLSVKRESTRVILVKSAECGLLAFSDMNGPHSSVVGKFCCDQKPVAHGLLRRAGLSVPLSCAFTHDDVASAVKWAKKIGFPVVVKPSNSSQGRGVTTNILSPDGIEKAWLAKNWRVEIRKRWLGYRLLHRAFKVVKKPLGRQFPSDSFLSGVLVEKHYSGFDYRIFVVASKCISVTQRMRAHVIGDGSSTLLGLISAKNLIRLRNIYLKDYSIPMQFEALDELVRRGLCLSYVPRKGELVTLRGASNLSAGGDSIDFSDLAHPEFCELAVKAVKAIPGMSYAGVDIITPDITAQPSASNYIISEIEYSPAPLSHFPVSGSPRDMAGAILDYYLGLEW